MKVGDYVTTKSGYIGIIKEVLGIDEPNNLIHYFVDYNDDGGWQYLYYDDISKSSSNIIDLIEVGDYVNGELVVRIEKDPFIKEQIDIWTNTTTVNYWGDISLNPIIDKNIKSIVTKEQFESMEYKVGE